MPQHFSVIYNVSHGFVYLNSNPMCSTLNGLGIFVDSRSNMIISTNEARNKCNNSFSWDFDWAIYFLN